MLWIVISSPSFFDGEAFEIMRLLDAGVDIVHLRKPYSSIVDFKRLLDALSPGYRSRIVVHDHFCLCQEYGLKGIHLNSRNPKAPDTHEGCVSRSCHSLTEIEDCAGRYDYVFLSPIFDSISKDGYRAAFSPGTLKDASIRGLINDRVVALGGISLSLVPVIRDLGFGGAAFLGDIWGRVGDASYISYLSSLRAAICGI